MKITISSVVILLTLVVAIVTPMFGEVPGTFSKQKDEMYQAAYSQLAGILELMPIGEEAKYGFKNRDEFKQAVLGVPYQEYSLSDNVPTGYWRVTVSVDGVNRALMRMQKIDEKWTAVGLSGAGLAGELGLFEKNYSHDTPAWGRLVRDYDMSCDYVQFDPKEPDMVTGVIHPLESAARIMRMTTPTIKKSGYTVREINEFKRNWAMKAKQSEEKAE